MKQTVFEGIIARNSAELCVETLLEGNVAHMTLKNIRRIFTTSEKVHWTCSERRIAGNRVRKARSVPIICALEDTISILGIRLGRTVRSTPHSGDRGPFEH